MIEERILMLELEEHKARIIEHHKDKKSMLKIIEADIERVEDLYEDLCEDLSKKFKKL